MFYSNFLLIEKKLLPGICHVLKYSYSFFERNQSMHTQIILQKVCDALALALSVYQSWVRGRWIFFLVGTYLTLGAKK